MKKKINRKSEFLQVQLTGITLADMSHSISVLSVVPNQQDNGRRPHLNEECHFNTLILKT